MSGHGCVATWIGSVYANECVSEALGESMLEEVAAQNGESEQHVVEAVVRIVGNAQVAKIALAASADTAYSGDANAHERNCDLGSHGRRVYERHEAEALPS